MAISTGASPVRIWPGWFKIIWAVKPAASISGSFLLSPATLSWQTSLTDTLLTLKPTQSPGSTFLQASLCLSTDLTSCCSRHWSPVLRGWVLGWVSTWEGLPAVFGLLLAPVMQCRVACWMVFCKLGRVKYFWIHCNVASLQSWVLLQMHCIQCPGAPRELKQLCSRILARPGVVKCETLFFGPLHPFLNNWLVCRQVNLWKKWSSFFFF